MSGWWGWIPALVLLWPGVCLGLLGALAWWGRLRSELGVNRLVQAAWGLDLGLTLALAWPLWGRGQAQVHSEMGSWFASGGHDFAGALVVDRLSWPLVALACAILWAIAAFSRRYLHREAGHLRFHLLLLGLGQGVLTVLLASSLDLLVIGWELTGLASVWLVAFFLERPVPVTNALRAFVTYRVCDVGLLAGAIWLHHEVGDNALRPSPQGLLLLPAPEATWAATVAGMLLLWGAMGKSALHPMGAWLPRAMEGPTPSSALAYGALSIHLGPYLLLRSGGLLAASPWAATAVVLVGLTTAAHATWVGRVQPDVKGGLAYASMAQVGLIVAEIGLGWTWLALAHLVGHACLRSWQLLRAPSRLHDLHRLELALGAHPGPTGLHWARLLPQAWQDRGYRHALERGHLEGLVQAWVLWPFLRAMRALDGAERAWALLLSGEGPEGPPGHPGPSLLWPGARR